jgi:two-component system, LytTR family, response regulator
MNPVRLHRAALHLRDWPRAGAYPPVVIADGHAPRLARTLALLRDELGVDAGALHTAPTASRTIEIVHAGAARVVMLHAQLFTARAIEPMHALVGELRCAVIVVGATPSDAIRAFALGATDCMPDPSHPDRVRAALDRAAHHLEIVKLAQLPVALRSALGQHTPEPGGAAPQPAAEPPLARFSVRHDGRLLIIPATDVDWMTSAGNYVQLRIGERSHSLRECMSTLERRLDPARFARIHRSVIVNLDRVVSTRPIRGGDAMVITTSGAELRLSRSYRDRFNARLRRGHA